MLYFQIEYRVIAIFFYYYHKVLNQSSKFNNLLKRFSAVGMKPETKQITT